MSATLLGPISPHELKSELKAAALFLKGFIKNPVQSLKRPPNWSWPTTLIVIGLVSITLGAMTGFGSIRFSPFRFNFAAVIGGIIVTPISSLFVTSVLAAIVKYSGFFVFQIFIPLRLAITLVFLATIPWMLVSPVIDQLPVLSPIGAILSGLLAIVALSENTQLKMKNSMRLVGAIVGVFVVFWIIHMVRQNPSIDDKTRQIPLESIQILKQEMKNTD